MKMYENPDLIIDWDDDAHETFVNDVVRWKVPSNLAIIKYWGKYGEQLPRNPSLSLTLDKAYTDTSLMFYYAVDQDEEKFVTVKYDDVHKPEFEPRIEKYFKSLTKIFPFIEDFVFDIHTINSFPHSSGIASSASSMAALALCLCDMERYFFGTLQSDEEFFKKASYVARLGSGSACRSLYRSWVEWGESDVSSDFSNLFGTPVQDVHESFLDMQDSILITSTDEKSVSSSAGHELMEGNVYAEARYQQANDRLPILLKALKEGDWSTFGKIAENEALTLHAMMMCSEDSYILMNPNSIAIIELVKQYRAETGNHVYFSLDAGPNIHLLYPSKIMDEVHLFIRSKLIHYCQDKKIIFDRVGYGPEKVDPWAKVEKFK